MKLFIFLITLILLLVSTGLCQNLLNNPESVVYDLNNDRYLVSNFGNGNIIQINDEGNQTLFYTGLPRSRGITIYQEILFVVHDDGVSGLDLETAEIVYSFSAPELIYPNDIAFDSSGNFYITDYMPSVDGGGVYRINYTTQSYLELVSINSPNGITYDYANNRLLACGGYPNYQIFQIDPTTGSLSTPVYTSFASHDGIVLDLVGNVYISSWQNDAIYRYNSALSGSPVIVVSGLNDPADIYYNKWTHEMISPNFSSNNLDTAKIKTDQFTSVNYGAIASPEGVSWCVNWIDYDQDGYQDLFVTNIDSDNELFNNNGDGTFSQIFSQPITDHVTSEYNGGSSWADFNNDNYPDLFISCFNEATPPLNRAYINNGDGTFAEISSSAIVATPSGSVDASWADYDNDGLLDLYVVNHNIPNFLYKQYDTGFAGIYTSPVGTDNSESNGCSWTDYDNDGDLDLIALNGWYNQDFLYRNDGDNFTRIMSGDVASAEHTTWGASWGDYDNDLDMDLFIISSNWYSPSASYDYMYENNGDGTFSAITGIAPVTTSGSSFGSAWGDYDNDADLDLVVSTYGSNLLYENLGDGSFELIDESLVCLEQYDSEGTAWADYDNDGDLDLYVANSGANSLFQNSGNLNNWINIRCIGTSSNCSAIGAKVLLKAEIYGESVWQKREISSKTGRSGQNSLNVHFGLGNAIIIDSILIKWPSGIIDVLTDVTPNQFIDVTESIFCGDVNDSGGIDILDIVFLINFKYKGGPAPDPLVIGNTDGIGEIDILDIVYLINFKYKGGPEPICNN
ncbi:MAG: hypothetical protein GY865_10050 [candidate division Zixibacteria bacterium]|nr:hypothetical protein [candidate division Zixibacteria bacterium]